MYDTVRSLAAVLVDDGDGDDHVWPRSDSTRRSRTDFPLFFLDAMGDVRHDDAANATGRHDGDAELGVARRNPFRAWFHEHVCGDGAHDGSLPWDSRTAPHPSI